MEIFDFSTVNAWVTAGTLAGSKCSAVYAQYCRKLSTQTLEIAMYCIARSQSLGSRWSWLTKCGRWSWNHTPLNHIVYVSRSFADFTPFMLTMPLTHPLKLAVTAAGWGDVDINFPTATPANFIDASSEMLVSKTVDVCYLTTCRSEGMHSFSFRSSSSCAF